VPKYIPAENDVAPSVTPFFPVRRAKALGGQHRFIRVVCLKRKNEDQILPRYSVLTMWTLARLHTPYPLFMIEAGLGSM
jgi:hypothetical protein